MLLLLTAHSLWFYRTMSLSFSAPSLWSQLNYCNLTVMNCRTTIVKTYCESMTRRKKYTANHTNILKVYTTLNIFSLKVSNS